MMYEDEKFNNYLDKKRKQEELHNILEQQTFYKHLVPPKEPSLNTYGNRYEPNEPDKLYTLGGFKVPNVPIQKGPSRKQNLYLPPNPIVNPLSYYNQYIDPNANYIPKSKAEGVNDYKYIIPTGSKSVLSTTAHNVIS